jgi:hypothetical protein
VDAWRRYYVAAVASDVDAWKDASAELDLATRVDEEELYSALKSARLLCEGGRESAVFFLPLSERLGAILTVDIQRHQVARFAGRDADVRVRVAPPVAADPVLVGGRVLASVRRRRGLEPRAERENEPAESSVGKGCSKVAGG